MTTLPVLSPKPILPVEDDMGEVEDPRLAALAAEARARWKAKEAAQAAAESNSGSSTPKPDDAKHAIVQLLIESDIPETKPLFIKIRTNNTLEKPRIAWCNAQRFSEDMTRKVFPTWRGKRLFDSTTVARLGVTVDAFGVVSILGDPNIYTDEDLPKIHLQAWTEDLYAKWKREEAEEEKRKAAAYSTAVVDEEPVVAPEPNVPKIRLILKAKGKEDFKISVNPVRLLFPWNAVCPILMMRRTPHSVISRLPTNPSEASPTASQSPSCSMATA